MNQHIPFPEWLAMKQEEAELQAFTETSESEFHEGVEVNKLLEEVRK